MSITVQSAAQKGQLSIIRSLLAENPALLNSTDVDGRTALHWAASAGYADVVRYLVDQKCDVDLPDARIHYTLSIDAHSRSHIASAGHEPIAEELIGAGANVNKTNDKGITPLHYAASKAHVDIGKLLISRGAQVN
ncbi:ankyrin [Sistotremastrum suecicum HHB10207 ss-3]|uniref:Ankyrin n=1 Tax=Sistotremastrum suecicum HHB10207 ss-3 TaxID=1314776 RepID=A0A166DSK1_9AGAM|nr:ankyrin [Sistotremastrum suecicum HHB10207 ss-3]